MTDRYQQIIEWIEGTEVAFIERPDGTWSVDFEGPGEQLYVIGESKCKLREFARARKTLRSGQMPIEEH